MSRSLPLDLIASKNDPATVAARFQVDAREGYIKVRGQLSTGTRGWVLRGEASYRRATVTLQITAIETEVIRVPDLEYHRYEATIHIKQPGRYHLRIAHAYVPRGEYGQGLDAPVFEKTIAVS